MVLKHVCLASEFNNSAIQKSQNIQYSCPRDEFSFHFGNQNSHKKRREGSFPSSHEKKTEGFPGDPVAKTPNSQCRGAQVLSPVRELAPACNN